MDRPYPIFIDISGRPALVIGGGPVAARKARRLADFGAAVTVVSPEVSPEMEGLAGAGSLRLVRREYEPADIHGGLAIVVACTDDPGLNEEVARLARSLHVLANSADPPGAGDVSLPSVVTGDTLTVAISTGGLSPALAKKLRKDIGSFIGAGYGPFLEFLKDARERLKTALATQPERAEVLTGLVESGLIERFREDPAAARVEADRLLEDMLGKYAE